MKGRKCMLSTKKGVIVFKISCIILTITMLIFVIFSCKFIDLLYTILIVSIIVKFFILNKKK